MKTSFPKMTLIQP